MGDELSDIFDGEPQLVATGFGYAEGPVWHPEGYLYFVDIPNNQLLRWGPGHQVEVVRENTNGGNGLTLDLQGRLVMCESGNGRVARTEADGTITVLSDRWDGKKLNRPNDVAGRSDGSIYFTDPGFRDPMNGVPLEEREVRFGGVFCVSPDGNTSLVSADCAFPNGLAFSPDERVLYVANSFNEWPNIDEGRYIRAFDVQPDGSLSNSRVFADMTSDQPGVPDGLKVDDEGRVFCGGSGGMWVFDQQGRHLATLVTPEVAANLAFGGDDRRTLYITAKTSLFSAAVKVAGVKVPSLVF